MEKFSSHLRSCQMFEAEKRDFKKPLTYQVLFSNLLASRDFATILRELANLKISENRFSLVSVKSFLLARSVVDVTTQTRLILSVDISQNSTRIELIFGSSKKLSYLETFVEI